MSGSVESPFIYGFEQIGPELLLLPLAARRALDRAGLKLSLEAWRSLGINERRALAMLGADDEVDVKTVAAIAMKASPMPERIDVVEEPDARTPPLELSAAIAPMGAMDSGTWSQLRGLDRFVLLTAHQKMVARKDASILETAFEGVMRHLAWSPTATADTARVPTTALLELSSTLHGFSTNRSVPEPAAGTIPSSGLALERTAEAPGSEPKSSSSKMRKTLVSAVDPTQLAPELTVLSNHLNAMGQAHMVNIGDKHVSERRAVASAVVKMRRETAARLLASETPKGDVLSAARIAGIMAAKRTPELIPLCHVVVLTHVAVDIRVNELEGLVTVKATAEARDRTGVEMEAMTAVSVSCLTIYDMLKGIDREMVIGEIKLMEKSGGRSGFFRRADEGEET